MTRDELVALAVVALGDGVAEEVAKVYSSQVVLPNAVVVEEPSDFPSDSDRRFPGWPGAVLVLSDENQGVCSWGLSLDGPTAGAVLVGGDVRGGVPTVVYCASVNAFVAAMRWDGECNRLGARVHLQAQAETVDETTLAFLRGQFDERPSTFGWPGLINYRFERGDVRIMLWAADGCDWFVNGPLDDLRTILPALRGLSDLADSLWSTDDRGAALLRSE